MESMQLHTVTGLAEALKVPAHRVAYVIKTRSISPVGVAGTVRLFSEAAAKRIASEIQRIEDERGPRGLP